MNRPTVFTSLLAAALVSIPACTGTEIEVSAAATGQLEAPSMQPSEASNATFPIPPIDKEQPTTFETATFALG